MKILAITFVFVFSNILFAETLTWNECVTYTKEHNLTLKSAQESIKQAQNNVFITKKNLATNLLMGDFFRTPIVI